MIPTSGVEVITGVLFFGVIVYPEVLRIFY
jgi:hypothetical protein